MLPPGGLLSPLRQEPPSTGYSQPRIQPGKVLSEISALDHGEPNGLACHGAAQPRHALSSDKPSGGGHGEAICDGRERATGRRTALAPCAVRATKPRTFGGDCDRGTLDGGVRPVVGSRDPAGR